MRLLHSPSSSIAPPSVVEAEAVAKDLLSDEQTAAFTSIRETLVLPSASAPGLLDRRGRFRRLAAGAVFVDG
jgi:hypothetical protein